MRFLQMTMALGAMLMSASGATTNNASVAGWCRSLSLKTGSGVAPGGSAGLAFSTYDGTPGTFLRQDFGSFALASEELRPRLGVPGVYETDYGLFRPLPVGFSRSPPPTLTRTACPTWCRAGRRVMPL